MSIKINSSELLAENFFNLLGCVDNDLSSILPNDSWYSHKKSFKTILPRIICVILEKLCNHQIYFNRNTTLPEKRV